MVDADVGITHLVVSTISAMIGGMDQNTSEPFGNVPNHSEDFGSIHSNTVKTENHTLTVREAARAFENAGVARTERSITNWCQLNRQGVSRLDCYYEVNDHKYFITPQSVERGAGESPGARHASEPFRTGRREEAGRAATGTQATDRDDVGRPPSEAP